MVKAVKKEQAENTDSQEQVLDPVHKVIATDEYAGHGGTYIYDPATGKRTPVPEPNE